MTVLQRLLKYPHRAVFDTAPLGELALRVRHPNGFTWAVADELLTVTTGAQTLTFNLASRTVGQLASELQVAGFEVADMGADFAGLSASVLVEGRGSQAESNGDQIKGFTNPLHALFGAFAVELREARRQVGEALKQMVITTAEGEWLDLWGTLYDVPRPAGFTDAEYQPEIPREAFRIRVNALAIEQAILDATGKSVQIEEPWGSMFRLDESALSGDQKFYNGESVGYHLIRPVSKVSIDWSDVLLVIERNRAAGVIVLPPEMRSSQLLDASIDGTIWSCGLSLYGAYIPIWTDNRLDYLLLSDEEITRNWPVMISQLISSSNADPLLDPESIAFRRTIAKASIVLSDGPALGEENAVFPRAELTQDGGKMRASDDLELSSVDQRPVHRPVDFISTEIHSHGELDTGGPVDFSGGKPSVIISRFVDASINGTASFGVTANFTWITAGRWGDFPWSASQYEMLRVEHIINRMHRYANTDLNEDLQQ